MVSKQTSITNATGLHARPASLFVTEAKKYQSNVTIKNVDKDGTTVEVACDGEDEQAALDALIALIDSRFGE